MNKKYLKLLFWLCLAVVTMLSLMPNYVLMPGTHYDKVNHVFAYLVLSTLSNIAFERGLILNRVLYLFAYGVMIEVIQSFIPGREFSFLDMCANGAGIGVFFASGGLFLKKYKDSGM